MDELEFAENIAEGLRQQPYRLFRNDCLTKSVRLCSECRKRGISARLVFCALGLVKARLPLVGEVTVLYTPHVWVEVRGRRIETSRPLGSEGHLGIAPSKIRPVVAIRLL